MSKKEKALAYSAHRSTWGGRSIQFFDLPSSSTIWDELRRIKENSNEQKMLGIDGIAIHSCAISNNYCGFLEMLSSMQSGTKNRIKVNYEVSKNGRRKLAGIEIDEIVIKTHTKCWEIQPKTKI